MANTTNFGLALFPSDPGDALFLDFRTLIAGETGSNMLKIDQALLDIWKNGIVSLEVESMSGSTFSCTNEHVTSPTIGDVYLIIPTATANYAEISIGGGTAYPIMQYSNGSYSAANVHSGVGMILVFDGTQYVVASGVDGVGITSVEQTTTSTDSGGANIITVTLTNGSSYTFTVRNGLNGTTFTPSVSDSGDISWTNNGGATNPTTKNIKGPRGITFTPYVNNDGVLSWTNDGGADNPNPTNIKGSDATVTETAVTNALYEATLSGALYAAENPNYTTYQVRNIVYAPAGTDPSSLSVPNGTIIMIGES